MADGLIVSGIDSYGKLMSQTFRFPIKEIYLILNIGWCNGAKLSCCESKSINILFTKGF